MSNAIVRVYYQMRALGYAASAAWSYAAALDAWRKLEEKGLVRDRVEPDDYNPIEEEEYYAEPSKYAHEEKRRAWRRRVDRLNDEGVWYVRAEYLDPRTGRWEFGGSCGGVVGYPHQYDDAYLNTTLETVAAYRTALAAHEDAERRKAADAAAKREAFRIARASIERTGDPIAMFAIAMLRPEGMLP